MFFCVNYCNSNNFVVIVRIALVCKLVLDEGIFVKQEPRIAKELQGIPKTHARTWHLNIPTDGWIEWDARPTLGM